MRRCLELAALGLGNAAPNPLVGAVIVYNDRIIGEGYHQSYGGAHAEVNAVNSVSDVSLLSESTLYVNLEPCAHHGKTPPCADLITYHKFKQVVICNGDPYEKVAGQGIKRIQGAGIDVVVGVLEAQGRILNRRFFTFHENKRPYIILKWAQTIDGYIDELRTPGDHQPPLKITGSESHKQVHRWRTEESAILVGRNTATLDNPRLTARHWPGNSPLRLVIDPQLQLAPTLNLLSDGNTTWVYNALKESDDNHVRYIRIENPSSIPSEIVNHLFTNNIQSVIIEGGRNTIEKFYSAGLWDEARVFTNPMRIGKGISAPSISAPEADRHVVGDDLLQMYYRE